MNEQGKIFLHAPSTEVEANNAGGVLSLGIQNTSGNARFGRLCTHTDAQTSSVVDYQMVRSPSLETRNIFATLRSKRISDFVSGGGTADHLTGSPLTN